MTGKWHVFSNGCEYLNADNGYWSTSENSSINSIDSSISSGQLPVRWVKIRRTKINKTNIRMRPIKYWNKERFWFYNENLTFKKLTYPVCNIKTSTNTNKSCPPLQQTFNHFPFFTQH